MYLNITITVFFFIIVRIHFSISNQYYKLIEEGCPTTLTPLENTAAGTSGSCAFRCTNRASCEAVSVTGMPTSDINGDSVSCQLWSTAAVSELGTLQKKEGCRLYAKISVMVVGGPRVDFTEATSKCLAQGGSLANAPSIASWNHMLDVIKAYPSYSSYEYYIDAVRNVTTQTWQWRKTSTNVGSNHWAAGHPLQGADCITVDDIYSGIYLRSRDCRTKQMYICQMN